MARYNLKDKDGVVVNVIEWDGVSEWPVPEDHILELIEEVK